VNKFARISVMCLVIVLGVSSSVFAADSVVAAGGAIGVGLTVIGAAYGIGRLAGSALESMARQPEVATNIQIAMIIAAALIEGFTFYALYICSTPAANTL
jgi:F-type H+-transporting ATPase subunit c